MTKVFGVDRSTIGRCRMPCLRNLAPRARPIPRQRSASHLSTTSRDSYTCSTEQPPLTVPKPFLHRSSQGLSRAGGGLGGTEAPAALAALRRRGCARMCELRTHASPFALCGSTSCSRGRIAAAAVLGRTGADALRRRRSLRWYPCTHRQPRLAIARPRAVVVAAGVVKPAERPNF